MMLFIDKDYAGGDDDEISEEYQEHCRYIFFRDMETTRRVSSEMGLAVHGDLGQSTDQVLYLCLFFYIHIIHLYFWSIHILSFLFFTID